MTDEQPTAPPSDPSSESRNEPIADEAEQEESDVEPFAGDDDILSGHLGTDD